MIYLNIYLAVWLWTSIEPIQDSIDDYFATKRNIILLSLWKLLGCQMCLTLWITLAITQNWTMAMLLSLIAQRHTKLIE
jgi:hypothetical protein